MCGQNGPRDGHGTELCIGNLGSVSPLLCTLSIGGYIAVASNRVGPCQAGCGAEIRVPVTPGALIPAEIRALVMPGTAPSRSPLQHTHTLLSMIGAPLCQALHRPSQPRSVFPLCCLLHKPRDQGQGPTLPGAVQTLTETRSPWGWAGAAPIHGERSPCPTERSLTRQRVGGETGIKSWRDELKVSDRAWMS